LPLIGGAGGRAPGPRAGRASWGPVTDHRRARPPVTARDEGAFTRSSLLLLLVLALIAAGSAVVLLTR